MRLPDFRRADKWVSGILSFPGIDDNTLAQKKIYWLASLAVTLMIFCLTLAYHLIFPQLRILIYYGIFLTLIFLQGVIVPIFLQSMGVWWQFINQLLVALATLFSILKLGGIPTSGGLIFVGLAMVFFSLNFKKRIASFCIFGVYIVTVILSGILHPLLTIPSEMTPAVNISLYVINLLWISVFAVVFVMSFISKRVKLEQIESNRLKEIAEVQSKLYTNITHEFRTPLTIITGMADLIKEDPEKWITEGCNKIRSNADILLNLVNQMLDIARLESGGMQVRMIRANINLYIGYVVELFRSVADEKEISLNYYPDKKEFVVDYDPEKLLQILSNLLSNALKFTGKHGIVTVSTNNEEEGWFTIIVKDNGKGIAREHLQFIFDRFYRIDDFSPGSGLGLAITKELTGLINGTISVKSRLGAGSEFIVKLPVTYNAPVSEVLVPDRILTESGQFVATSSNQKQTQHKTHADNGNKPQLLIVEDNVIVIQYLTTFLENNYEIIVAENGREGLKKALESVPDIILSDVMMPTMDGAEMLEMIRNDFRISHIPVILLTAKADSASRLEGLKRGADAYFTKPFDKEELMTQMSSLIELRKRLRERYSAVDNLDLTDEKIFHYEDVFMKKIREKMIANISDELFDINKLCSEMAISRTQLYRKFRILTDKTPNDYFMTLRLHRAFEMLKSSDISVSQAAYGTGFKNLSHFSRSFTREFGINPREILR